jgi:acetyltransferase-like isoleucine patch superfamily enzyme
MPFKLSFLKDKGKNVYIAHGCDISFNKVSVGSNVYVGPFCYFISPKNNIVIGNFVMFGPNVIISSSNHDFSRKSITIYEQSKNNNFDKGGDVIIEDDVWIGSGAIILQGVRIGKGSIVGAGSVVSRNVPEYSIYTGVKNRMIKERFLSLQKNKIK